MAATVLLDSKQRASGSVNDCEFVLAENLQGTYELSFFQITNSIYNVVAGENDKVYVTHSVDGAQVLTLTPGYYLESEIAAELKAQLDTISAVVYTVSYSSTSGKLTIAPDSGTISFTFGTNTAASARRLLGFLEADTVAAASVVSDIPLDLQLHDVLVVSIPQDSRADVTLPGTREASFIIPISNVLFGDRLFYRRNDNFNQLVKFGSSISRITIQFYSIDGDLLDVNGAEWVMTLRRVSN